MRFTTFFAATALLFLTVPLLAGEEAEPRIWLVGTRENPQVQALARSHPGRDVVGFRSFRGYAAVMTEAEAAELRKSPHVRFVEPNYERHAYAPAWETRRTMASGPAIAATPTGQTIPYGVDLVRAPRLWPLTRGRKVRVGVIDTGIDHQHPDFQNLYTGRSRMSRRPLGYDFVNGDADAADDHGHGTHVAGTVGARDNDFGVIGVAPEAELFGLKVLRPTASGQASGSVVSIIKAIDWAIENDIDILNLSLGSDQSSTAEEEAFKRAWDAGILAIAATGNDYGTLQKDEIGYPAAYPNVVAVGAVNDQSAIAGFSQRGTQMALVAPGVGVFSTFPRGTSEVAEVQVEEEEPLAAVTLEGSPLGVVSGDWVYAGLGKPEEIPASVAGKIAVIRRGELFFRDKAKNAKDKGAAAVVIINNVSGLNEFNGTLRPIDQTTGLPMFPEDANYEFPLTVGISQEDGEDLLKRLGTTLGVSSSRYDYGMLQGTSMATPHVAGVAALVWSLAPDATAADVRDALIMGARDLGAEGWDTVYGYGLVDAWGAAMQLVPHLLEGGSE